MPFTAIDAQFNRAVDIVQSLPKGGPVQTNYEEKLCLYSLYKQEGNISAPRPGLLDMLGRAKWDSWNKQKGTDKTEAKQRYVSALLKILRKHMHQAGVRESIAEIESYHPPRPPSPSSSTSSYHSSQASPPDSPPHHYPPPDPQLPIPDVSPDFVPPSALNSSHRSLLNLLQAPVPLEPSTSHLSAVPARQPSIRGSEGRKGSVSSVRYIRPGGTTPSVLGSVNEPRHPISRPYSPMMPTVRDFGTPDMSSSPHPGFLHGFHPGTPGYPVAGSTSTYTAIPPSVPQTLQAIQISLTALHERLSTLERSQAMILRRNERRKSWKIFGGGDADELDEAEDEAYRAKWGYGSKTNTATTTHRRKQKSLSARALFLLLTAIRRAMVDVGVGMLMTIAVVVVLGGGWVKARRTLTRAILRAKLFIQES